VYRSLQALSFVDSSTLLSFGASWLPLPFGSCRGLLLNRGIFNALVIVRRRLLVAAARRVDVGKNTYTLIYFLLYPFGQFAALLLVRRVVAAGASGCSG